MTLRKKIAEATILYKTAMEEGSEEEHNRVVDDILSLLHQELEDAIPKEKKHTEKGKKYITCVDPICRSHHLEMSHYNDALSDLRSALKKRGLL